MGDQWKQEPVDPNKLMAGINEIAEKFPGAQSALASLSFSLGFGKYDVDKDET
jgi:hypothetical protein